MKKHRQMGNRQSYSRWVLLLFIAMLGVAGIQQAQAAWGTPTNYQAENANISNATTASSGSGFTGSGYVTGLTSEWSKVSFERSYGSASLVKFDIRYSNGTAGNITNLSVWVGSNDLIQNLVLPSTGSWNTYATISITLNIAAGYQGINIKAANASTSANIDFAEISIDDGVAAPSVSTPTFSPAAGTYTSAQSVSISTSTSGATIYYTQDGSTPTTSSTVYSAAISVGSSKTIKALAAKSGMTNSSVSSATYTINIPPPAPGAFTQTAPASGATGVSTSPAFSWAASSNAASYALVVSTSASYASPVINQTGITGTSYTSGIALANSTVYYYKVTATNVTGSTDATNAGLSFTTSAPTPVVATPTFSVAAGTYTTAQTVTLSTATSGATIYYTSDGSTPTTASSVYSSALSVGSTQTIKAIAAKSGSTTSSVASATYTINIPPPAPGSFTQTAPASGATGVSTTPSFSWAASSNAANYALVVSTSSSYASPVINQTVTGTSYTAGTSLANSTVYYWKVTATNSTSSTVATNAGLSFTTSAVIVPPPVVGEPGVIRELWTNITGATVASLTSNANYPNSPTSSSVLTSFNAPLDFGTSYGQRIRGYLAPTTTGSYTFYLASDDDSELWLSTNDNPANKVKIASVTGWTNYLQYTKFSSQTSASITLTAGNYYYIEALHKEDDGGDHCTVAWQGPGISQNIITSANLVTAPPIPLAAPGAFNLSAPANAATGVSLAPTFSWSASSDVASYTLVVSTSSSYTSPVINQSGITSTSYVSGGLAGTTTYYWKVTAVNATGSTVASNSGRSFTTLTPPAPGAFTQTSPASGATSVSRTPTFTWAAASNASTYSLVVSTSNTYASPVVNVSSLTSTSYSPSSNLSGNTVYYWKVTAVNSTGSTVATNQGISFTTNVTTGTYYYVSTSGVDAPGRGGSGNPFATPSYAATQIAANQNNTIYINAGTYNLTQPVILPLGVNIEGAGTGSTILKSNGVALQNGVTGSEGDYPLWIEGSLIQAGSPIYSGANPRYGDPSLMIPAEDGNQTLSGFSIDGNDQLKAGVWVLNRNNVTMHHVNFSNMKQTGAVFTRGDMYYYVALPDGKWMQNTKVYDCNFTNAGSDNGQQVGCLQIGGIDGCEIYNINIQDNNGEGIKFMHVGHHRNTKIHDCYIRVPESHPAWGEFMSIELWNLSYGNEVYNIDCNTWMSYVNFNQITSYEPVGTATSNLKLHDSRMIDLDGSSSKESVEAAHSGVEIYNCYFQDKGFGIAFWNGLGQALKKNLTVRNNIFANVSRSPVFGFGNSSAVFVPDAAQNIKIYNNVFDRMGNGLQLNSASGVEVKNNVFINTEGADVENGSSVTFNNNLKYHTNAQKANWNLVGGPTVGSGNVLGDPGFKNTGSRWTTYYQPASSSSFAVNKGTDVGLPYSGVPDIGRWEFGVSSFRQITSEVEEVTLDENAISTYPNPTTGIIKLVAQPDVKVVGVHVMNTQGKTLISKSVNEMKGGELDLSAYPNDIYILKVKHNRGVVTKKIVLVK